jgi:RNA polymerase sigma-70 factor (ECF subfamily)
MSADSNGTDDLLQRATVAEGSGVSLLLDRHRRRLRSMVAARLDRRIAARVDPSDIVQETLADAVRRLPEYLRDRPVPYWVWLRQLAIQRVAWWRRFHLKSSKRTVARERALYPSPREMPTLPVVDQLIGNETSPSEFAVRDQEAAWIRRALEALASTDRQVLELRYIEDYSFGEIAAKLDLGLSAVKMRHLRALKRLRGQRDGHTEGSSA